MTMKKAVTTSKGVWLGGDAWRLGNFVVFLSVNIKIFQFI